MISKARKLNLIEKVLKIDNEALLDQVEALLRGTSVKSKTTKNLSEKYAGSLKLTDEQYADFQSQVSQGRQEWNRNI